MIDSLWFLLFAGFVVGTLGTLIGAGGGFILVPLLLLIHPELSPEVITAVSMAIVAANAISGSLAYSRSRRIDYKAGLLFAAFTIPGSILGVYATSYIPARAFHIIFGVLLIIMAFFLFMPKDAHTVKAAADVQRPGIIRHTITDSEGITYSYRYNRYLGVFISLVVGFLSPLLGIGGGIIHVPALINWLNFPVYIATATSHFILAVMSAVSVVTHLLEGNYHDPFVRKMVLCLGIGAIAGAQLGAFLSHRTRGNLIVRSLAVCLGIIGIRVLFTAG